MRPSVPASAFGVACLLAITGCITTPNDGPVHAPVRPISSSLSISDLETHQVVLAAPVDDGWALGRVVLEGPGYSRSPSALLAILVETSDNATAHVMVGTWVDRTTVRPVGATFLAVPPNTVAPYSRFLSHAGGDLSSLHDEFIILIAAEGGPAVVRYGLLTQEEANQGLSAIALIADRPDLPVAPEASGVALMAGTFWHYRDTTGYEVDYHGGYLEVSGSGAVPLGSAGTLTRDFAAEGGFTPEAAGIASLEFVSVRQPGLLRWTASVTASETIEEGGSYAFGSFFATDVVMGAATAVPLWSWPDARIQLAVEAQVPVHFRATESYTFERPPEENPVEPGLNGEITVVQWGYSDVDLARLFGWPMSEFGFVTDDT